MQNIPEVLVIQPRFSLNLRDDVYPQLFISHPLEQMMLVSISRQFNAVVQMKFLEHITNVISNSLFAQVQQFADISIGFSFCQMDQHIHFTVGEDSESVLFGFAFCFADA